MSKYIIRTLVVSILCSSLFGFSFIFTSSAEAQTFDAGATKSRKKARGRSPVLREKIYKYLVEAEGYTKQQKYDSAFRTINVMQQIGLTPAEEAQYINFKAYIYSEQERFPEAIKAYEKLLQQPKLSIQLEDMSMNILAKLYLKTGESEKSIEYMARYLKYTKKPPASSFVFLAQAFYNLKDNESALHYMAQAKSINAKAKQPMSEMEYDLLHSLFLAFDQKYDDLKLLQEMVKHYPSNDRWQTLIDTCKKLIEEHSEQSPMSLKKLNSIMSKAEKKLR